MVNNPYTGTGKKIPENKGMTPNTAQKRPNSPKHSAPKPFKLNRNQGK